MANACTPKSARCIGATDDIGSDPSEADRRSACFNATMDRLEMKLDRLLYAVIGMVVVLLGAMTAGFWAVIATR